MDNSQSSGDEMICPLEQRKRTWSEVRRLVTFSYEEAALEASPAYNSFNFKKFPDFTRLYCLGPPMILSREQTLLYFDIPDQVPLDQSPVFEGSFAPLLSLNGGDWRKKELTKAEQLQRERKRCLAHGITSYDFHASTVAAHFLWSSGGSLYMAVDDGRSIPVPMQIIDIPDDLETPVSPRICPTNPDLLVWISAGNIFLHFGGRTLGATACEPGILAGDPSYIMQEEFDRYIGMWWQPVRYGDAYYLLFEETDERQVAELVLCFTGTPIQEADFMRYPRPGQINPVSSLKLMEIRLLPNGDISSQVYSPSQSLKERFPWSEYMTRAGWTPDGNSVYALLLSRDQCRVQLVQFGLEYFLKDAAANWELLYEETCDKDHWINTTDLVTFLPSKKNHHSIQFFWPSDSTGFMHLRLVTISGDQRTERIITSGNWEVHWRAEPHVDLERDLVYFLGAKDSPIETHLYAAPIFRSNSAAADPPKIFRLTSMGKTHCCQRNGKQINVFGPWMVDVSSGLRQPQKTEIFKFDDDQLKNGSEAVLFYDFSAKTDTGSPLNGLISLGNSQTKGQEPWILTHYSPASESTHYAMLFLANNWKLGDPPRPTILNVYGGPEVQTVKNMFMGRMGFGKFQQLGYNILLIDGRGSSNRGRKFAAWLKHEFGSIELQDQIEVLKAIAKDTGAIDLNRVAVKGWSYGGYLALMALAKHPDVFKICIAGAPVTAWELYDTAYCERYLRIPVENPEGYGKSSLLNQARNFPDEPNRLLLIHGMADENVHITHSLTLVRELSRHGKPHETMFLPGERHAVRSSSANDWLDSKILHFIVENL